jgi:hypothetical protein
VKKQLLAVITSKQPYAPETIVAELGKLPEAQRIDLAVDLMYRDSAMSQHWGGSHVCNTNKTNNRRRTRSLDLACRLLVDVTDGDRLDAELAKAPRSFDEAFLAIARIRVHARAKQKVPRKLLQYIAGNPESYWCGCEHWVREVCSDELVRLVAHTDCLLWQLADLSPLALKKLAAEEAIVSANAWGKYGPDRDKLCRIIEAIDDKAALAPLLDELAKRTVGDAAPVTWKGWKIVTYDSVPAVDDFD